MTVTPEPSPHSPRAAEAVTAGTLGISSRLDADGEHRVTLIGELDIACVDALHGELLRVEATDAGSIVVDLGAVSFIDSSGLRTLITAVQRSRSAINRLILINASPPVQRTFVMAGLQDYLSAPDVDAVA